jgi:lysophospholipase L1-like esterase
VTAPDRYVRARRPRPKGWTLVLFALLPTLVLFGTGELAARILYAYRWDIRYLRAPYGFDGRYPYRVTGTMTAFDGCAARVLTRTSNSIGTRGAEWPIEKTPGRLRIVTAGASSTYGLNNPDDKTWPVLLERELRGRHGRDVEVLNAGRPRLRLEEIRAALDMQVPRYRPDVVIYYEGYNNVQDATVNRLHERHPILSALYYRSMLYTYAVGVVSVRLRRWEEAFLHEARLFRAELDAMLRLLRTHGVRPVFVLQVTRSAPAPELATMDLDDDRAVAAFVLAHASEAGSLRAYQAQVLIERVRRVGKAEGITVIDPRDAFAGRPTAPLFCTDIHLTDEGNALLAATVASRLDPWTAQASR